MENSVKATMSMGRGEHAGRGRGLRHAGRDLVHPMLAIEACLCVIAADFPDFADFD